MVKIKAVLFDLDGVLVDAKQWHYKALNQALEDAGYDPIGREEHLSTYDGLPTLTKLQMLSDKGRFDMSKANAVYKDKQKYTMQFIQNNVNPNSIIIDTLKALRKDGFKLAVCSNAIKCSVELMLEKSCIRELFDLVLSNEDVDNPKPHPEIYLKAMEELGVRPEECMIIEDNEKGFKAAIASGSKLMKVKSSLDVNYLYVTTEIHRNEHIHNVIVLMAGEGSRFRVEGFSKPKPFIDVEGKPMVQHVIDNLPIPNRRLIFMVRDEHIEEYQPYLDKIMEDNSIVITVNKTEGAAITAMAANHLISNDDKLTIVNADQKILETNLSQMFGDKCAILTFKDDSGSRKWSYAKVEGDRIVAVREKVPISNLATVGLYYFSKGRYFTDAVIDMVVANDRYNNEFYTCPCYSYIIKKGIPVVNFTIENSKWYSMGTPSLLKAYLRREKDD